MATKAQPAPETPEERQARIERATDLEEGVAIRFRYRGGWDYGYVVNVRLGEFQLIDPHLMLTPGQRVAECVWKGERLTLRRWVRPRKWNYFQEGAGIEYSN